MEPADSRIETLPSPSFEEDNDGDDRNTDMLPPNYYDDSWFVSVAVSGKRDET
jgi:hypothetical protein